MQMRSDASSSKDTIFCAVDYVGSGLMLFWDSIFSFSGFSNFWYFSSAWYGAELNGYVYFGASLAQCLGMGTWLKWSTKMDWNLVSTSKYCSR